MAASSSTEIATPTSLLPLVFNAFLEHGRAMHPSPVDKEESSISLAPNMATSSPLLPTDATSTAMEARSLKNFLHPDPALSSDSDVTHHLQIFSELGASLETQPQAAFHLCLKQLFDSLHNQNKEQLLNILKNYLMEHAGLSEEIKQTPKTLIDKALAQPSFLAKAAFIFKLDGISTLSLDHLNNSNFPGLLATALVTNTTLTSLNLRSNNIGDKGAASLATALATNTTLTSLDLRLNNIGAEGAASLANALATNTALTSLDLRYNNIGDEGVASLATALATNTTLTSLNLSDTNIGTEGTASLATALATNTTLTSLDLEYNNIDAEGAKSLAKALATNTALTSLNLGNNNIGAKGAKSLAKALATNTALTSLNLWNNFIGAKGAKSLAKALATKTTLASLNLGNNLIGDEGTGSLAAALATNTTLTSLNLWYNNIGDKGADSLATALATNATITSLNLGNNDISDEGARSLATALATNVTITSLDLEGNRISKKILLEIESFLEQNRKNAKRKHTPLFYGLWSQVNKPGAAGEKSLIDSFLEETNSDIGFSHEPQITTSGFSFRRN